MANLSAYEMNVDFALKTDTAMCHQNMIHIEIVGRKCFIWCGV